MHLGTLAIRVITLLTLFTCVKICPQVIIIIERRQTVFNIWPAVLTDIGHWITNIPWLKWFAPSCSSPSTASHGSVWCCLPRRQPAGRRCRSQGLLNLPRHPVKSCPGIQWIRNRPTKSPFTCKFVEEKSLILLILLLNTHIISIQFQTFPLQIEKSHGFIFRDLLPWGDPSDTGLIFQCRCPCNPMLASEILPSFCARLAGDSGMFPGRWPAGSSTQCILSQVESVVRPPILGNNNNSWHTVLDASLCQNS